MILFDTHCHLQDEAFAGDFAAVVARARTAGVLGMALCGYDASSNLAALDLSAGVEGVFPTVGFHPHDAKDLTPAAMAVLAAQAARPEVIGIGEIGLDFYRDLSPHDVQREALEAQLALAAELGKPVSLHTRGAEEAIYDQLAKYASASPLAALRRPVGVMHCFGGTLEQARRYVELGFLVSIPCAITYPKNEEARRIARELPLESLVIETDSPYLPPQSRRGQRNEPALILAAVEAIAAARRIPVETVARQTTENACRLWGVRVGEPVMVA